jgi:hypothetical protein
MTTPFPPAVPLVNVTGAQYGADTTPRTGRIIFSLQQLLTDSGDKISIPPFKAVAILGVTNMIVSGGVASPSTVPIGPGCFSIVLVATDYAGFTPALEGVVYYATTYDLDGSAPYTVNYLVPHVPSPVDISALTTTGD